MTIKLPKNPKPLKAYALINSAWKEWGWNNQFQQLPFSYRNGTNIVIYPLAIFETLKEARYFNKFGRRKEMKIKQIEIKVL
jgi:hypothetical protein